MVRRLSFLLLLGVLAPAGTYGLVLARGRVIDPESGLDAVRWVGINGGKVATISSAPLTGRRPVEIAGQQVLPLQ